jgi:hypothetical protein
MGEPAPAKARTAEWRPADASDRAGPGPEQEDASSEPEGTDAVKPLDLEAPAGIDSADPIFRDFRRVAGELGLDQDQAGKVLELHQRTLAAQRQLWREQVEGWEKAAREDHEIGGDGFEESHGLARSVLKEFGTSALEEVLEAHGHGSHPEIVRLFARVGRALDEARSRW